MRDQNFNLRQSLNINNMTISFMKINETFVNEYYKVK